MLAWMSESRAHFIVFSGKPASSGPGLMSSLHQARTVGLDRCQSPCNADCQNTCMNLRKQRVHLLIRQGLIYSLLLALGILVLAAGLQGLPFAEDLMDLIDTIAQRIFGSPFNSQRALRNIAKSASEAM